MWNVLIVRSDDKVVANSLNEHLRQNVLIVVRQKSPARPRLQVANPPNRFLHLLHGCLQTARDFRNAPFAQRFHEFAYDAVFQSVLLPVAFQLQQETFAQIASAHPRRMKRLNDLQHLQNLFGPDVGRKRQLVHAGLKIAVIINVPDDHLADLTLLLRQIG